MTEANELEPGTELLDENYNERLEIVDRDGNDVTLVTLDDSGQRLNDTKETFTVEGVQHALDDDIMTVVSTPGQDEYDRHDVSGLSPEDVDDSDLYIRFGNLPEGGRSYDNRNDVLEDGVSVYACDCEDGVYKPKGQMLQTVFGLMMRHTYLVTGERVGTGADGEPVLQNVEIVEHLSSPEGVGGWIVDE